ncbi:hypothetical protein H5410_041481 [Solanum commersonii]|uniref:Uncharacterized protein n=1 Tax=Solanum commersonii TaxID=4109 RepID=A0A9J5XTR2_SOLCO|nr:hypothetical protein H5410_041481 [Solanum commersonii]
MYRGPSRRLVPLAHVAKAWSMMALHEPWKLPHVVVPHVDSSLSHAAKVKLTRGPLRAVELSKLRESSIELAFLPTQLRYWFTRASTGSEGFHAL